MKVGYIALLAALAATPVMAAEHAGHAGHAAMVVDGSGTLNSVDAARGSVNISHAPIAAIGWPAMTMDFTLESKSLAAKLKPGQMVSFKLKQVGATDYVITAISAAK